jgi:hypothetical protein
MRRPHSMKPVRLVVCAPAARNNILSPVTAATKLTFQRHLGPIMHPATSPVHHSRSRDSSLSCFLAWRTYTILLPPHPRLYPTTLPATPTINTCRTHKQTAPGLQTTLPSAESSASPTVGANRKIGWRVSLTANRPQPPSLHRPSLDRVMKIHVQTNCRDYI